MAAGSSAPELFASVIGTHAYIQAVCAPTQTFPDGRCHH